MWDDDIEAGPEHPETEIETEQPETLEELPSWAARLEKNLSETLSLRLATVETQLQSLHQQLSTMATLPASTDAAETIVTVPPVEPETAILPDNPETLDTGSKQTEPPASEQEKEPVRARKAGAKNHRWM